MTTTSEEEELLVHLVDSWVETYKKSAVTMVLLSVIAEHGPATAAEIAVGVESTTGWTLTERGLYRSLRRLASMGAVTVTEVDAPRTGAKRKLYELSTFGAEYRRRLVDAQVDLGAG